MLQEVACSSGASCDTNSACVLVHSSQVMHSVMSNYDEGTDKIVSALPFKCAEGDVASEDMMGLN